MRNDGASRRETGKRKGTKKLTFQRTTWFILGVFLGLFCAHAAMTCEECQERDKKKSLVQQELTQKEKDLDTAFKKRQFQKVTQTRKEVTALRKKLLEFRGHEEECKKACSPEVVKKAQCRKLINDIVKLEESSEVDTEKVDALYRDLAKCHRDLAQLKKSEK
jgi:demethoxyubiquinone hydroxylase (CLK1/Coq7/Cat5 family)